MQIKIRSKILTNILAKIHIIYLGMTTLGGRRWPDMVRHFYEWIFGD